MNLLHAQVFTFKRMPLTPEQVHALRSVPIGTMANKVRLARTMLAITQTSVAEKVGLSSPQLSDIERGEYKDIPLENGRDLAEFFGCAIEDLFPVREALAS